MSVKNKATDRNHKGKIDRKYTRNNNWQNTPSWWIAMYMNQPKRRENKKLCSKILHGADPDELIFPLGNRKPHVYYW
jgi:hypothetical protein